MCTHCHWGPLYKCCHLFSPLFMLWYVVHFSHCGICSHGILSGYHPARMLTIRQTKPNRWFNVGSTATFGWANVNLLGPTLICSWNNFAPTLTANHNNKLSNCVPTTSQHCTNQKTTVCQPLVGWALQKICRFSRQFMTFPRLFVFKKNHLKFPPGTPFTGPWVWKSICLGSNHSQWVLPYWIVSYCVKYWIAILK